MPNELKMRTIENLNEFREWILNGPGIQIVKYYAEWSGTSQMMGPVFLELSEQFRDKASFYTLDIDQLPEIVMLIGVFDLPMISIYLNGNINYQSVGLISKIGLLEKIQPVFELLDN